MTSYVPMAHTASQARRRIRDAIEHGKLRYYGGRFHVDVTIPIAASDSLHLKPCWIMELPDEVLTNIVSHFIGQVDNMSGKEWELCTTQARDWITLPDHQTLASLATVCQRLRRLTVQHLRATAGVNVVALSDAASLQHSLRRNCELLHDIKYLSFRCADAPLYLNLLPYCHSLQTLEISFEATDISAAQRPDLADCLAEVASLDTLCLNFKGDSLYSSDIVIPIVHNLARVAQGLRCVLLENLACRSAYLTADAPMGTLLHRQKPLRLGFRGPRSPKHTEFQRWFRFVERGGGPVEALHLCLIDGFRTAFRRLPTSVCSGVRYLEISGLLHPDDDDANQNDLTFLDASSRLPALKVLRCPAALWLDWHWPATLKTLVVGMPDSLWEVHKCIDTLTERIREQRARPKSQLTTVRFCLREAGMPGYLDSDDWADEVGDNELVFKNSRQLWTAVDVQLEDLKATAKELGITLGHELADWYRKKVEKVQAALEWAEKQNEDCDSEHESEAAPQVIGNNSRSTRP